MNKERRKAIEAIAAKLDELKGEIETLQQEEQDYYDNMPESFQSGDKGERAQAAADNLAEAIGQCEEVINSLNMAGE